MIFSSEIRGRRNKTLQPKGVKSKMKGRKLKIDVNGQAALMQKGIQQTGVKNTTLILFVLTRN